MQSPFQLISTMKPMGDQPQAIDQLVKGVLQNKKEQVLMGVTGSGKTFTMAHLIQKIGRPTLVISHNKTLAAQLYSEFKEFFPNNAVEYFVSYYDYYQPEAYVPHTDTYIEKDASINDDLDRLRLAATSAALSREDTIIVSSVSCIYGLGSPEDWQGLLVQAHVGEALERDDFLRSLIAIQYERKDTDFKRGSFRVRGETVDFFPSYGEHPYRIQFTDDTIGSITLLDRANYKAVQSLSKLAIYPAKHFVTTSDRLVGAIKSIEAELGQHIKYLIQQGKDLEAKRLESRTRYDMEMLREVGYCAGIENYSRHLSGRTPGSKPYTFIDYMPKGFLTMIDESHQTIPQLRGMYNGDLSRKKVLVEHGFRLPSALDNRPLNFQEFEKVIGQIVYVSATPGPYEMTRQDQVVEQIIRPTGLMDPEIMVRPTEGQIDFLIAEIKACTKKKERVLITTLTKRMAEDLSRYLKEIGVRVHYIHSEFDAFERVEILRDLRLNKYDCLVGINLLREGLDLPEVALVAILDADKEGFLRSDVSLIQIAGRAARHVKGRVIMFADKVTDSMKRAIEETSRRRKIQAKYNEENHVTPESIQKEIRTGIERWKQAEALTLEVIGEGKDLHEVKAQITYLYDRMARASSALDFEKAACLRDQIKQLEKEHRLQKESVFKKNVKSYPPGDR
ncbi:MAG: excinuclease ABC subunit B [Candidatus Omnitrophica bacterium CG11_big_fil_rev_8_21_14_0_20_45_26]|uniref:UvrABC system protein B n=1 Tax=Candidatus Abzuiibacterium crystallinum TaxID=1974748 RepID=A0A2H0LLY7_9BACT|nr:MAG: excinuclease ABC subunit B [Candidatus Omnitrophica bacterium CG11_big_fil_rev_8_21_14_0_20_45_26]PIW64446.1 MAG: excinuclease ABC subunit B [Candidatus Omnitrophica bacterium CG12_big_fil_rev_8_21_14_0_65_45_16]